MKLTKFVFTTLLVATLATQTKSYDLKMCVEDIKNSIGDVYNIANDFLHKEIQKTIPLAFDLLAKVGDAALFHCKGATLAEIEEEIEILEEGALAKCASGVAVVLLDAKGIVADVRAGKIAQALQLGINFLTAIKNLKPLCSSIVNP